MADPLDDYITAAAAALDLPLAPEWQTAIKANLAVTLKHANLVAEFRAAGRGGASAHLQGLRR